MNSFNHGILGNHRRAGTGVVVEEPAPEFPKQNNLVLSYKCESINDIEIPNEVGANGTEHGDISIVDNSYYFDGNDWIDANISLNLTTDFSIYARVKKDNSGDAINVISQRGNSNKGFVFILQDNILRFVVFEKGSSNTSTIATLDTTEFVEVGISVKSNDVVKFYVNGVFIEEMSIPENTVASENLRVMTYANNDGSNASGNNSVGTIDEVYVWGIALSDADFENLIEL